ALAVFDRCPPCTQYEQAKLRSALWFRDAHGKRALDPCNPTFSAWSDVLYPLAWLGANGWPWHWVEDLFVEWSAEGGEEGRYPGRDECIRRFRGAKPDKVNLKRVDTLYWRARELGWTPPAAVEVKAISQPQTLSAGDIFEEQQSSSLPP